MIDKTVVMDQERPSICKFPYFVNDMYSLGYWLKDYGYYPKNLPLFTYMDHGMTLFDTIPPHEIYNDAPLIFKFSPRLVDVYKQQSKKPVYNLLNPAIHCRLSNKIEKAENAEGSLFFIAHTTPLIDDLTEWEPFVKNLERIPIAFHPIDICLHPVDMEKGLDVIFKNKGFNVFSASNMNDPDFMVNFYSILKRYRYALSNIIGSYTFYSVEMDIPFSLYGEEPKYLNKGDRNIEMGEYESYKIQKTYQKAKTLFKGLHTTITGAQKDFVEYELGMHTTISRAKASYLLYKAYLKYSIQHPTNLQYLKGLISSRLQRKHARLHGVLKNVYNGFTFRERKRINP